MAGPSSVADECIRALNFSPALQQTSLPFGSGGGPARSSPLASAGARGNAELSDSGSVADDVLKVYVRVRPTSPGEEHCVQILSETELLFNRPAQQAGSQHESAGERYSFTRTFGPLTPNDELFRQTTQPLVRDLFRQRDALLFAYGVTNAGKTYSIQGSKDDPGVVPRALKLLFEALDEIETRRATQSHRSLEACTLEALGVEVDLRDEFRVVLSYLEVYNENVYDLLADQLSGIHLQRAALKTKEDGAGRIFIPGLKEIAVSSHEEALAVILYGAQQRQVAQTRLNSDSSRSHAILTVQLCRVGSEGAPAAPYHSAISRLCIVDLAGAERVARTQTGGARLKEASKINTSLLTLGRCMEVLRANAARPRGAPARPVPFRESKMTRLLHDYFVSGSGTMSMIVAVHPGVADADETVHTLRFSAVARDVHGMDLKYPASGPLSLRAAALANAKRQAAAPPAALEDDDSAADEDADEANGDYEELQQQLSTMRRRLMATEARCLSMESEIRDEVAAELTQRLSEMEAFYKQRLEEAGAEERHQEKLNLYKAHSARKAERDATASHLQLVERVKEYERALVAAEEQHAAQLQALAAQHAEALLQAAETHSAELQIRQRAHEQQLAEAGRLHAAELRRARAEGAELLAERGGHERALSERLEEQSAAYEKKLADLTRAHAAELQRVRAAEHRAPLSNAREAGLQAGLEAALSRAEEAREEAAVAQAELARLRAEAAQRERRGAAELAEKEAQLASNMRLEVESLEFQARNDQIEKQRLATRVAELEARLRELVAVAQHNMAHGVGDGAHAATSAGKGRAAAAGSASAVRADGRTLIVGARAGLPPKSELLRGNGAGSSLRYDHCHLEASSTPGVAGGGESGAGVFSGELRRTMTGTGVGLILTAVADTDDAAHAEPSPAKRKLAEGSPAARFALELPAASPAAAAAVPRGERAPADPIVHASEPKRRRSGELEATERRRSGELEATGRGADVRMPLLDARQPTADGEEGDGSAPPATGSSERAKQIAAKVAAREQEAAAKQKPAARLLGMPFGRGKPAPPPEPTPIAGRTRTRAARK